MKDIDWARINRFFGFKANKEIVVSIINEELSPREEKVLRERLSIDKNTGHTMEEVGKLFNITRERVRQIETKGLNRVSRAYLRRLAIETHMPLDYDDYNIKSLELPINAFNILSKMGCKTLSDFKLTTIKQLKEFPGCGKKISESISRVYKKQFGEEMKHG